MKKIISLFQRNYEGDRLVRNQIVPGAEWVVAGKGIATRKWDGTCCMFRGGKLYRRHEVKQGRKPPLNFEPAMDEADPNTGKQQGWVPVGDGPEDRWHREALARGHAVMHPVDGPRMMMFDEPFQDGTYELVGEKIQGNPEHVVGHWLVPHGAWMLSVPQVPRDFDSIREYLRTAGIEGIVWHHTDGRMCKVKTRDFGIKRKL